MARKAPHVLHSDSEDEEFTWGLTTVGLTPYGAEDPVPSDSELRGVSPAPTLGRSQSQLHKPSEDKHKPKTKSAGGASHSRHTVLSPPPTRKVRRRSTRVANQSSRHRHKPVQPPKGLKAAARRGKQAARGKGGGDDVPTEEETDLTEQGKFEGCECTHETNCYPTCRR